MPRFRRVAACLLAGVLLPLVTTGEADAAEGDPLDVVIDTLSVSSIPGEPDAPIVVEGTIENVSDSTWSNLLVYPLTSYNPMTTSAEVADAVGTPADTYIGDRRTAAATGVDATLPPGATTRFRLEFTRSMLLLSGEQGVYWLGVQVLGDEDGAREPNADGRARILLPLVDAPDAHASLGVILPFRDRLLRDSAGKVVNVPRLAESFATGRFARLLDLSASSGTFPLTWLLDPAVVDAATSLAAGNPALALRATTDHGTADRGTADRGTADRGQGDRGQGDRGQGDAEVADAATASWVERARAEAAVNPVLTLPYGDLDVAASYRDDRPELVADAAAAGATTLGGAGMGGVPVLAPSDGRLPWDALGDLDSPVLLSKAALESDATRVDVTDGPRVTRVVRVPGSRTLAAVRQRVVAEAAVHAISDGRSEPLVVVLSSGLDPGPEWRRADFFGGLSTAWVTGISAGDLVVGATATDRVAKGSDRLRYPREAPGVPSANIAATRRLAQSARTLASVIEEQSEDTARLERYSYLGSSERQRDYAEQALQRTTRLQSTADGLLGAITVSAPSFVTMSSDDGPFQVVVTNGLDRAVTVGVKATAGSGRVSVTSLEPISIPAGSSRAVRLHARSTGIGVFSVTLRATDADGSEFGRTSEVKVRSSHVGRIIWAVLAGGLVVLVGLIVVRVKRQVRQRHE